MPASRQVFLPAATRAIRQVRFRFLDLWIKFGKIISKVCSCFNSGAKNKIAFEAILFLAPVVGFEPTTISLRLSLCFHKARTISSPNI